MRQGTSKIVRRGIVAIGLLVLALPAPALAADPWPSDGQNPYNMRNGKDWAPTASRTTKDLVRVWKTTPTFDSPVVGTPIIGDNNGVYVATENGEVYGIRRSDGAKYWERTVDFSGTGAQVEGSLLKAGNTIYAVASTRYGAFLTALDALTGNLQWSTQLDSNRDADSCGGPQHSATHNAVIVGLGACRAERNNASSTMRGAVVSVDATTGAVNWKTSTVSVAARGGGVSGTPIVWDGGDKAFVTTGHAYGAIPDPRTDAFLRLNLTTGAIDGQYEITAGDTSGNSMTDLNRRMGFTSPPLAFTAKDGKAYMGAGAEDGAFHVVDPLTMTKRSSTPLTAGAGPAGIAAASAWDPLTQRIIGVTKSPSMYFAIDQGKDGALAWAFPGNDAAHTGPVSVADYGVWSTSTLGFVDIQYKLTGHSVGRYPLGQPSTGGVSFYNNVAYVAVGVPSGAVPGLPNTGGALIALK